MPRGHSGFLRNSCKQTEGLSPWQDFWSCVHKHCCMPDHVAHVTGSCNESCCKQKRPTAPLYNTKEGSRPRQAGLLGEAETHLCPCCAISIALRAGTGDPPSVTLRTSMDFLSGRRFPCLFSIGESTRFLGGSVQKGNAVSSIQL